jgi:proteic killer suppression protein
MIQSFRHKGLRRLYEDGNGSGVRADQLEKIENILALLDAAESLQDLSLPSLRLHPLKGTLKGFHAVTVRANWRIVFRFVDGDCYDVDLVDYH